MTLELYAEDSYIKECSAQVVFIEGRNAVFNQSLFYTGGGGQPCDVGIIKQGAETFELPAT